MFGAPIADDNHAPLASLDDIVWGAWDVFPDDAPSWPGDSSGFKVGGYQQLVRGIADFHGGLTAPARLVPNLGPQVNVWTNPARDGLVVAQTCQQAQYPTGKVQHAMNKPTPVAIEHAQQNDNREQNVDRVNCHVALKIPIAIANFQLAIAD